MKDTTTKGVRTTEDNFKDWEKAAKLDGKKSRNDWIVDLCNKAAKRILRKGK